MNCDQYRSAIHDYARGLLGPADLTRVEEHMHGCENCVEFNRICKELTCADFVEFLSDYVEENLQPERLAVFDRHMTVCPDCINYLESYRKTRELGVEALSKEEQDVARAIPDDLINAILAARRANPDEGPDRGA